MYRTIEKFNKFFETALDSKLLINEVNEEISSFYIFFLSHLANKTSYQLKLPQNLPQIGLGADLFGQQSITVFRTTIGKDISALLNSNGKVVILTNYKNFKKYQRSIDTINGYNYLNDIDYLLRNILKIDNVDLINFCLDSPQLIYSETSKYLANSEGYSKEDAIVKLTNFIMDIRKSIFNSKKKGDVRKTFFSIKEEAFYKKFSFLTY